MSTSISLGDLGTAIINDKNLAIYPTQTNNAGKFLSTDGTDTSWADGGGNTDGFLSGLTVSGSGSNGLDLAFTRDNDTNINFSIPKYTIHTTAFNDGTLTIQQFHNNDKTVDILPTQSSNSGKFLTTDGTTLSWGDAGGASSYGNYAPNISLSKQIDQLTLNGNTLTAADGTTTYNAQGILFGNRNFTYYTENTLVNKRDNSSLFQINNLINGYREASFSPFDDSPHNMVAGGHIIYQHLDGLALKLNLIHFHYWHNTHVDMDMALFGSCDRVNWTKIFEWNHNNAGTYLDGYTNTTININGSDVTIPARGSSDLVGTKIWNNATEYTNHGNANGCRRYYFDNDKYYIFYMMKNIGANQHPNVNPQHNTSFNSQQEWEF